MRIQDIAGSQLTTRDLSVLHTSVQTPSEAMAETATAGNTAVPLHLLTQIKILENTKKNSTVPAAESISCDSQDATSGLNKVH